MSAVWYPFDVFQDVARPHLVRAAGSTLFAADGRRYLDAIGSWWVCLHGHNHPRLTDVLQKQAAEMDQVIYAGFTHSPAEALAAALVARYPGAHKCFYSDDGSTAVEVALKLALHAQQRLGRENATRILTLANSYHGDTVGAMSAAQQGVFTKPYTAFLFDAQVLTLPYTTDIFSAPTKEDEQALAHAETLFATGTIAAFICEPLVQGAGGMKFIRRDTLAKLWALAHNHGAYVIADEVMTGFGRTGSLFAADYISHPPDLACLSKGLTGGSLPLGVTLASEAIWSLFKDVPVADRFLHGHSFTANPITCAVALESWHLLHEDEEQARREALYAQLGAMAERLRPHPRLKRVRQVGGILAFEVVTDGVQGYLNALGAKAYAFFMERGVLLRPLGNTLYLLPPYCFTKEELAVCEQAILAFLG
jgi:adenosylmethionine-8-amino-7-oxononanoate aminotransferase